MNVLAVIELSFDPFVRIGDLAIRWQTIEATFALLAAIAVAALAAPRGRFFRDRMTLVIAGIVPGAVVGGRLFHVVAYWEVYLADPMRIFDPGVGSLSLLGAVLGGILTATFLAKLVSAPIGRWMDAAAIPLLIAIGFGKFAQLLGGSGQGLPFDGAWAVAFLGDGPWISAYPSMPAHPSQVYEGLWALLGIPIVLAWAAERRGRDAPTAERGLFVSALCWFIIGRIVVGFTWRDDPVLGFLNAEQVLALGSLAGVVAYRWWSTAPGAGSIVSGVQEERAR